MLVKSVHRFFFCRLHLIVISCKLKKKRSETTRRESVFAREIDREGERRRREILKKANAHVEKHRRRRRRRIPSNVTVSWTNCMYMHSH